MGTVLALIAIILGFIAGLTDADLIFNSLTWFVLALALEFLGLPAFGPFVRREP
jgi:hypothetical protein